MDNCYNNQCSLLIKIIDNKLNSFKVPSVILNYYSIKSDKIDNFSWFNLGYTIILSIGMIYNYSRVIYELI